MKISEKLEKENINIQSLELSKEGIINQINDSEESILQIEAVLSHYKNYEKDVHYYESDYYDNLSLLGDNVYNRGTFEFHGDAAFFAGKINKFKFHSKPNIIYFSKFHLVPYSFKGREKSVVVSDYREIMLADYSISLATFYPFDSSSYNEDFIKEYKKELCEWIKGRMKINPSLVMDDENLEDSIKSLIKFF